MAKKKSNEINKDTIVSIYTDYVLTNGRKPNSVYDFTKNNGMNEADFYKFFAKPCIDFRQCTYFVTF